MPNIGYRNGKGIYIGGATSGAVPAEETVVHGRMLYVGVGGDLVYQTQGGDNIFLKGLRTGFHDIPHKKIYGTDGSTFGTTTATDIISFA